MIDGAGQLDGPLFPFKADCTTEELINGGTANAEQHFMKEYPDRVAGSIAHSMRLLGNLNIKAPTSLTDSSHKSEEQPHCVGTDPRLKLVSGGEHFKDYDEYLRLFVEKMGSDEVENAICRGIVSLLKHLEKSDMTFSELLIDCKSKFLTLAQQYAEKQPKLGDRYTRLAAGWKASWKPTTAVDSTKDQVAGNGSGGQNSTADMEASRTEAEREEYWLNRMG